MAVLYKEIINEFLKNHAGGNEYISDEEFMVKIFGNGKFPKKVKRELLQSVKRAVSVAIRILEKKGHIVIPLLKDKKSYVGRKIAKPEDLEATKDELIARELRVKARMGSLERGVKAGIKSKVLLPGEQTKYLS